MEHDELTRVLTAHAAWLQGDPDGKRADLSRANLGGVNLGEADLGGANLREANLGGAYLGGVYLYAARGIIRVGPLGSRGDELYAVAWEDGPRVKTGCFWGTAEEFLTAVGETHGDNKHARAYRAAAELIRVWAAAEEVRDAPAG